MTATTTEDRERALRGPEKRLLALLGLPTFALALAITTVTTYLPVVARDLTSSTFAVGMLVAVEGLLALWLPLLVGTWSDGLKTRLGGRLPFMVAAAPALAAGLALMAFGATLWILVLAVTVFFAGYFCAYEPYRALYPDAIPDSAAGRAQSTQAAWRGVGTGLALGGGGLLLGAGQAFPFAFAAAILLAATLVFVLAMRRRGIPSQDYRGTEGARKAVRSLVALVRDDGALRAFLFANALWELSLSALKTFVILYLVHGLGFGTATAAGIVGAAAVFVLIAAATSGKVADRFGRARTMQWALPVYGVGLLVPFVTPNTTVVGIVAPVVALGGGVVMTLPYALLVPLMPERRHGSLSGFFSLSRGIGAMLGPLLGGLAIDLFGDSLQATHGYAGVWLVCGVAVLASVPLVRRLRSADGRD